MFYTNCCECSKGGSFINLRQTSAKTVFKMPVRRVLHMDNAHNHPASKIPVPARNHTPLTGTACSQAGKTKVARHEQEVPETELEKLDSLRSKLEQSVDAFIKARKELEEIFSAEGSSEQGRFLTGSSTGLKTELKRHRELTSRVELSLKENKDLKHLSQGNVKTGSSYEFLKSIIG